MRIIVASDIHLGYEHSDARAFRDFLDHLLSHKPDKLILLGDVFDFWRRSDADLLLESPTQEIMERLLQLDSVFVRGNHDYSMLELAGRFPQDSIFKAERLVVLSNGNSRFVLLHGYELEVFVYLEAIGIDAYEAFAECMCHAGEAGGTVASQFYAFMSWVKGKLDSTIDLLRTVDLPPHARLDNRIDALAMSASRTALLGLKSGDVFVFGHTHRPFIEKASRTVNTGSWVMDTSSKMHHHYLEITDQAYDLKDWPVSNDVRTKYATLASIPKPHGGPKTYAALKAAKMAVTG